MQANEPERKLTAIWVADVVGFSRMMGQDETGTLMRWQAARKDVIAPAMDAFRGRLFKEMGDSLLAEFPSAVMGLRCALQIQSELLAWNETYPDAEKILLRIGLHQGEVMVQGSDLLGDGVNVAARLEPLAPVGGICVSDRVREDVIGKLRLAFDDFGELALKNIGRKIRVHSVRLPRTGDEPVAEGRQSAEVSADGDSRPHNLPEEASSFIGRDEEVRNICAALGERRRLTLVGSGGVGKTRTALRAGMASLNRFRDGVWLVELAPLADAGAVGEAVCRAVAAPVAGARSPIDIAVAFLRQKNLLLILDNCEHVLAPVAELATTVLARCPDIAILATSREPLRIAGEIVYRLPSLPVPVAANCSSAADAREYASVCLFVQRASDAIGGYKLSDADAPHVGAICRRLDGVAMAIELAAARMTVLKPAEIKRRLDNAFRLLNTGSNNRLPRHQTLWATIDWSHSLLSPQEQLVLRRLSVFVDGFSLDGAVEAVSGDEIDPDDVLDLMSLLVDKSLVNTDKSGLVMRYRMLEATRHYAREKLKASGETGRDRRAADYLARFYDRA